MNTSVIGTHVVAGGMGLLSSHLVSVRVDSARRPRVRFTRFQLMIVEGGFMDITAGACNACGATGTALMKLSLGKDFFGRVYDRLSPSTDQSPKWYCEGCSMQKNLQRDFRDILGEFDKLTAGQGSALSVQEEFQRASLRLREISTILTGAARHSPFLNTADVTQLIGRMHTTTMQA
jgi:hypothetical protein